MSNGLAIYTIIHVIISLIGIAFGFVVVAQLLRSKPCKRTIGVFLWTTVATSVTGFGFPASQITPAHITGVISLLVLTPTVYAYYRGQLAHRWRHIFVIGSFISLYLNVFVLVVQIFQKIPAAHDLAPTQKEPPFAVAQGLVLLTFIALGFISTLRFHPQAVGKMAV